MYPEASSKEQEARLVSNICVPSHLKRCLPSSVTHKAERTPPRPHHLCRLCLGRNERAPGGLLPLRLKALQSHLACQCLPARHGHVKHQVRHTCRLKACRLRVRPQLQSEGFSAALLLACARHPHHPSNPCRRAHTSSASWGMTSLLTIRRCGLMVCGWHKRCVRTCVALWFNHTHAAWVHACAWPCIASTRTH